VNKLVQQGKAASVLPQPKYMQVDTVDSNMIPAKNRDEYKAFAVDSPGWDPLDARAILGKKKKTVSLKRIKNNGDEEEKVI